jgi:hypothetical protein
MTNPAGEQDILRGIIDIIMDQQELERHQRRVKAPAESIQDSMVFAYSSIISLLEPFLLDVTTSASVPDSTPSERKP